MRTLVDQYVVVEGHVVDLVVGREGKCLRADLHPNRLTLRFRVNVSFVVEDPVEIAVTVQWNEVLALSLLAVNLLKEVVPRVVTRSGVVETVSIVIEEGREVEILVQRRVAVRRVIEEVRRDAVSVRELLLEVAFGVAHAVKVLAVALRVRSRGNEEVIVLVACGCVHFGSAIVGQWTRPEVIALAKTQRGEFELLVGADAAHPEGTGVEGAHATAFRHLVRGLAGRAVLPHRTARLDEGANVVPFQVAEAGRRCTCRSTRIRFSGYLVGLVGCPGPVRSDVFVRER